MLSGQSQGRGWFSLTHIDKQACAPAEFARAPHDRFRLQAAQVNGGSRNPQESNTILTTQFSQFSLSPALMARLDANKFEIPTPVQIGCIPPALAGRDVLATAQTGTGKTLGYLIPIVEMLQKAKDMNAASALIRSE